VQHGLDTFTLVVVSTCVVVWALVAGVAISVLLVRGTFARIELILRALATVLVVYIVVAVIVTHDWLGVLEHTVVPHIELNKAYIAMLVAILGTTVSPYEFFWQSANRLEEMRDALRAAPSPKRSR